VLEGTRAEAQVEPDEGSPAVRLALSWLGRWRGAGLAGQEFWEGLTKPLERSPGSETRWVDVYCRQRDITCLLDRWRIDAGLKG